MNNLYKVIERPGLWELIDSINYRRTTYCLLQSRVSDREFPCLVVNGNHLKMIPRNIGAIPMFTKEICVTHPHSWLKDLVTMVLISQNIVSNRKEVK